MDPNQIGFVPGCSTQMNIKMLIEVIKKSKKSQKKCLIFIDFKSAYNTVNRKKLYKIM